MDETQKNVQTGPRNTEVIRKDVTCRITEAIERGYHPIAYTQTIDNGTIFGLQTPIGQFRRTAPVITKHLTRSCYFVLCPEWRTLTGVIHYHGIIFITDRTRWLRTTRPALRREGFICLKEIDNLQKWIEYFTKEAQIAESILKRNMPICSQVHKQGPWDRALFSPTKESNVNIDGGESGLDPEELPQASEAGQGADLV